MFKHFFISTFLAVLAFGMAGVAQPTSRPEIFPVTELREGMRGTAKTVFRGNKAEEFQVEILGVVPNYIGPKQDLIVGRLSGALAERTFVFAGMSGSPVYIDGKLVGAISYSFPFAKEPICGITPFEQMVSVVEQPQPAIVAANAKRSFSLAEMSADRWVPGLLGTPASMPLVGGVSPTSRLMAVAGRSFAPISTPLYFSGISQDSLERFAPQLLSGGMTPVAASAGGNGLSPMAPAKETTLLGGDSVVVHLARGDINISAAGTVTLRDGEKIYAFGHPFFSLGSTDLPMSESHVVTVIPNANNSFKLAVPDDMVGSISQDRATTVFGKLGKAPRMLPIEIELLTSRGRTERVVFESALDELLTPILIGAGVGNTLNANERNIGDTTIELDGEISIKGHEPIKLKKRWAGAQASVFASSAATIPVAALLRSNFPGTEITSVKLRFKAVDGTRTAALDRLAVDRSEVRAGETINVTIYERTSSGNFTARNVPVTVPAGSLPGKLTLTIGDGSQVQKESAVTHFTPNSLADLISTYNRLKRQDRLYAVLSRTTTGAVIGVNEMPNLPPSVLAILNSDRSVGGSKPSVQTTVYEAELPAGEMLVSGARSLIINVVE